MRLTDLAVGDFRSWRRAELQFEPGVNALVGPNGQGKTNLVEAIGYLATLGSHRVAGSEPLVRAGEDRAIVRGRIERGGRMVALDVEIAPGRNARARVNENPVRRQRDLLGQLRAVLFAPEDLALVKGDPAGRRHFLDTLLVQRTPRLAGTISDYERVLRQRASLLKSAAQARRAGRHIDLGTLDVWDAQLARHGAALWTAREALVAELAQPVAAMYETLAPGAGTASAAYTATAATQVTGGGADQPAPHDRQELLLQALSQVRSRELERGVNLVGPHRDDLALTLRGLPARGYASHGESWTLALALRLASFEVMERDEGGTPVLMLDDVFAELDDARRDALVEVTGRAEQVIVTAAVPADVPAALGGTTFHVERGVVERV
jgi:DNA replication and repair protein RecF